MPTRVVTVKDVLDGQVDLDLECFGRIYLNGWAPNVQVPGQVVSFLTRHLGFPIPSLAVLERIGVGFRKAVTDFAAEHDIAVVRFAKGQRKVEVMRPYLERLESVHVEGRLFVREIATLGLTTWSGLAYSGLPVGLDRSQSLLRATAIKLW
jgi:hypothetical protein